MNNRRIIDHPVLGKLEDLKTIAFEFDGRTYAGCQGDTIASALWANGIRKLRVHEESGTPRSIYCNIGHCYECRLTVNGKPGVRACMTELKPGMVIESGKRQPAPLKPANSADELPRTYADFLQKQSGSKEGDSHA